MLKNKRPDSEWSEFGPEDYFIHYRQDGLAVTLNFLCPGCGKLIGVKEPPWIVDFDKLTATGSILHTKPHGCGWHGYLTNGEFKGQIE